MNKKTRELFNGVLRKIKKNKKHLNKKELTNKDIAISMAEYSVTHLSTISDEKREMLDDMLTLLDELHMDIVNMYFWGGKTMEQIAQVYGKDGNTGTKWVSRRLQEAYKMMRGK